ncbi:MAG: glycoside hydrolase family 32 protein [Bacteroidota bacterium]|mgnify:CR=1 FL=1
MRNLILVFVFILSATASWSQPGSGYYNELYRPQYHFTSERNWIGEPSGLVYYDGEYHLFYQYNPRGLEPGYYQWGHAVSKDLVRWEHLPVAIFPDNLSEDRDFCTAGPGSVIIDEKNLLGLQQGQEKTMVAFYTSHQCGQRIAYSNDRGRTWRKYTGNPVIPFDETDEASGPKVFWYEPGQHWVMVLYRRHDQDDRKRGMSFFSSSDLLNWEFSSHLPGFSGNPDMVEIRVNNRPEEKKWVVFEGDGSFVMGAFNGKTFTPESIRLKSDFGLNFTGSKIWGNLPAGDGRVLQVAMLKGGEFPEMPFHGLMTFPSELSLRRFNTGTYLIRQPVAEIESLHGKSHKWEKQNLIPGLNNNLIKKVKGELFHIKGQFDLKTCDSFGFMFRMNKKIQGTELLYNVKRGTLSIMGQTVPLEPVDNKIYLEILIDRSSIEVYANNGRMVISQTFSPDPGALEYLLYNTGGELMVDKLEFIELGSAWRK